MQIQLQRQTGQFPPFVAINLVQQLRQAFQGQGGVMLGHNRGHDAIQIVSRIIFNRSLLYGMTHDFGQMLAHPPGNVMHALIVDGFNK
ncbi:Uncharacterised protein [Salmonella enterica subsp. enterica serovar Typhi]|nr:Uncharacterised protein [Salmonella enterica subsp. enterica serovar Typhi]